MRNSPRSVMVFAAGFGTRMGAMTKDRPKPLIEVAGRALIDHTLDLISETDAETVVVNLHYKSDMLRTHLAGRGVVFADEQPDILETGGGLKAALPLLGEAPVYSMNSDAVWRGPNPLLHLAQFWDPDRMDALLLCVPWPHAVGHLGDGDFLSDSEGRLSRGPGEVFSGLQIVKPACVRAVDKRVFSLNEVWTEAEARGRLFGASYPGRWADVGHPDGIALAKAMLGADYV
ncbi:MAG: nucleotidyltransferase family protein [Pseudomonadota bacterium]